MDINRNSLVRKMIVVLLIGLSLTGKAQHLSETLFTNLLEQLPQPPDNLQKALDAYGNIAMGEVPVEFRTALDNLNATREAILKPLYDKLNAIASSGNLTKYSPEEQHFLRQVQTLRSSWGDGVMYGFDLWIEYRPGIAKQFWTKMSNPLSATAQGYYQQLLQIEKSLAWQTFLEEAHDREGLIFKHPKIDEMQQEMSAALLAVPTKKVKFSEGSDLMVDITDADKTIEVIKRYDAKMFKTYQQVYNEQYAWWSTNFLRTKNAAVRLDSILQATHFGATLTGGDRQLITAMADVQGRIVGLLHHLTNISTKIISIAQQANMSKRMTEESIGSLKKLLANSN